MINLCKHVCNTGAVHSHHVVRDIHNLDYFERTVGVLTDTGNECYQSSPTLLDIHGSCRSFVWIVKN